MVEAHDLRHVRWVLIGAVMFRKPAKHTSRDREIFERRRENICDQHPSTAQKTAARDFFRG